MTTFQKNLYEVVIAPNKLHTSDMDNSTINRTDIPRKVRAFGRLWAIKYIAKNPNWRSGEAYEDEWHAFGGYDLNLWCEDGYLSVCAYPTYEDKEGFINTDHSNFAYIVQKGKQQ